MADRYLKHLPSGIIFIYQGAFAKRDDFIEVADLEGTPMPVGDADEPVAPAKAAKPAKAPKSKPAPVDDLGADIDAALSKDASRGLG